MTICDLQKFKTNHSGGNQTRLQPFIQPVECYCLSMSVNEPMPCGTHGVSYLWLYLLLSSFETLHTLRSPYHVKLEGLEGFQGAGMDRVGAKKEKGAMIDLRSRKPHFIAAADRAYLHSAML
ncbi:hypothetical protein ILYODFUR_007690 [Ilyodon furcidens]|uniref:Uncharacterized protein n=1 Tax=Ilyodon furcidens TaxID=33524 RepID=A0ABV0TVI4_9TELE